MISQRAPLRVAANPTYSFGIRLTMITVANVVDYLDQFAPPALAAAWDNVGLLLGELGGRRTQL